MTTPVKAILAQSPTPQASSQPLSGLAINSSINISGLALGVSLITAIILLWSSRFQLKSQKLKLIDELTSDYYYILYEFKYKVNNDGFSAEDYWRRYWSQVLREYDAWCNGVVDDKRYARWLRHEKKQHDNNILVGNLKYQDAYPIIKSSFSEVLGDDLFDLMDELFKRNAHNTPEEIVKKFRGKKNNQFSSLW
jgi:hypothetical protein